MSEPINCLYEFGPFSIDAEKRALLREGEVVPLAPKTFDMLLCLVEHHSEVLEKGELMDMLWPDSEVEEANLPLHISALRKALGERPNERKYIVTVPGKGYRFAADVKTAGKSTSDVILARYTRSTLVIQDNEQSRETEQLPERLLPAHASSTGRRKMIFIGLTLIALIAAAVVYFIRLAPRGQPIRSVAVLPFVNETGDPNLEYLSDGLSESLIDRLSQFPGVKVIARSSSFKYKGQQVDPQETARALGVEALVIGRVVRRGDELQVRAELVDAQSGAQIWGEQYSHLAADIQGVQEEIAHTVSEKLLLRLSGEQEQHLTRRATGNSQAYQFYLNGLFYYRQAGIGPTRRALDYFSQAVALDPDFAPAWAGLAQTHLAFAGNSWIDPKEAQAKAKTAVQNALRLDETLTEAHTALATIKAHEWDWSGAEREFKRAIELSPSLATAHDRYAWYLSSMGRQQEALAEIRRAQELDPLRVGLRRREAWVLHLAGRSNEALALMEEALKLEPPIAITHMTLGFMYEGVGMYEEAIAEHQKAISMQGEDPAKLCYLGWALAGAGKRTEAQAIVDKLNATKEYVSPAELAALYALLGDKEGALALLEKAYAAHDLQLGYLNIATQYDSLRSDPRFQDLVRRVGLPQ